MNYHIRKCTQDHVNNTPRLLTIVYVILLHSFLMFPWCSGHFCKNYHIRKCAQTMSTVPQHCQQLCTSCLFFFSQIFLIFSLYSCLLPHLEMCTDHVNSTPTLSTTVYIMSILFLLSFPDFLIIFVFITIFGNVHRPCKQYPSIANNSLHHVYSSSPEFFWFSGYLSIDYHM